MPNAEQRAAIREITNHEVNLVSGGTVKEGLMAVAAAAVPSPWLALCMLHAVALGAATGAPIE